MERETEDYDDELVRKVDYNGDNVPGAIEYFEAVIEKAREVAEEANEMGGDMDLSSGNVREIDTVDLDEPFRDTRVRFWLRDCTLGHCDRHTIRPGHLYEHNGKVTVVLDIREF